MPDWLFNYANYKNYSRDNDQVFLFTMFSAMGEPNVGDLRDAINTEKVSVIDSVLTVASTATIAANDRFDYVREFIQPMSA